MGIYRMQVLEVIVSPLRHIHTQTMTPALTFAANFKLGHYMKIPPRKML